MTSEPKDVFLCYNSQERELVEKIARRLEDRGLAPWFDAWSVQPGTQWIQSIEKELPEIRAAAVFVGRSGVGPWQQQEIGALLRQFTRRDLPVIPVILPGCEQIPELPPFLEDFRWIDFRQQSPDPLGELVWGITGIRQMSRDTSVPQPTGIPTHAEGPTDTGKIKVGQILGSGRFTLRELLGRGGFGSVWQAWDDVGKQVVAIKVLHDQFMEDDIRRKRFFRGADRMAALNHPNIVRVIETRLDEKHINGFVMEFLSNGDLQQAIRSGRVETRAGLRIVIEVGRALSFAHENGVIHRDIKPANILLDSMGTPKLTDFDLMRSLDSSGGTPSGGQLGSVPYLAPEALGTSDVGVTADIYSLAVTALFVIYGETLPPNEVMLDRNRFIQKLDCAQPIKNTLIRATDPESTKRYSSIAEFTADLERSLETASGGLPWGRRTGLRPGMRSDLRSWLPIFFVLVLFGSLFLWWLYSTDDPPEPPKPPEPTPSLCVEGVPTGEDSRLRLPPLSEVPAGTYNAPQYLEPWLKGQQQVVITESFEIMRREAVVADLEFAQETGGDPSSRELLNQISWNEAQEIVEQLSSRTGCNFSLPSREQWLAASIYFAKPEYENLQEGLADDPRQPALRPSGVVDLLGNLREWSREQCPDGGHFVLGEDFLTRFDKISGQPICSGLSLRTYGFRIVLEK